MTPPNPTPPHGQDVNSTPRTDGKAHRFELSSGWCYAVPADFARTLERELNALKNPPTPPTLDEEQLSMAIRQAVLYRTKKWMIPQTTVDVLLSAASRVADYQPGLKSLLEVNEALREVLKAAQKVNEELQKANQNLKQALEIYRSPDHADEIVAMCNYGSGLL